MIGSTARGYNPKFEEGFATVRYLADKYIDNLEFITLDAKELVDEYGDPYQVIPVLRISFK